MKSADQRGPLPEDTEPQDLKTDIYRHIKYTLGSDPHNPDKSLCFHGLAYSIRDRLIKRWLNTQRSLYDTLSKRVYFLSLEFLPGRFLRNYLISLDMEDEARQTMEELGYDLDEIEEEEWDAGLGNGGLGRLASCYLDSMACRNLPGYGYGIRYDYGMFHQVFENGYQVEKCDNWMRSGSPWEIKRKPVEQPIRFYGRSEIYTDQNGKSRFKWVGGETVIAMACDFLIPGYGDEYVTNMRLWSARASREFSLSHFNRGDFIGAIEAQALGETISKVLYPNDESTEGKELRLKQQYFFVAATISDILRRYRKQSASFKEFPDYVVIQLNDTHPSVAIAELMRVLMDEENLEWDEAYGISEKTFAYTNHTVLPEALETWPVDLFKHLLPRHLEIIYEINQRFLDKLKIHYPDHPQLIPKLSIISEGDRKYIRMSHLAFIVCGSINGVAELHSRILKKDLFHDFDRVFPGKLKNVTNGVTPRRWIKQANPGLSDLITSVIGPEWILDLSKLKELEPFADDKSFQEKWRKTKRENKIRLARYILRKTKLGVNPDTLFDVQVKRIHEYKRQLLNALHVITLYRRIKHNPKAVVSPRTVIFSGKSAPGYKQAKLIIKLINAIAETINNDPDMKGKLRAVFLPNYCVSQAEKIHPAADLSEQISTAGMEASGTGNMKMSLNGALTIGTLDGANVEIREEVGEENIFIFGLTAEEVTRLRNKGYNPGSYYEKDPELKGVIDMIGSDVFCKNEQGLFRPIYDSLLNYGVRSDYYMILADYRSYLAAQHAVEELWNKPLEWTRKSILNTARMGKFSSDRAVLEYAADIWKVAPLI